MEKLAREAVRDFLRDETLFAHVNERTLTALSGITRQVIVGREERLFTAGQRCEALHFVAEGVALLVKTSAEGRQRILHRAMPGEMVGAVPFFDGSGYPASLVAETECLVLVLPRESLLTILRTDADVALAILGGLVGRLRMMVGIVEQLSFEDIVHRLWSYLVAGSTPMSADGSEFPRVFDPLPRREHIADSIGSVREVVSRRLSALVESGHLRVDGRRATLLRPLD